MSITELMEAAKPVLQNSMVVITVEYGYVSTQWINIKCEQVATGLGYPRMLTNPPVTGRSKQAFAGVYHFGIYWKQVLGKEYCSERYEEFDAAEALESWVNAQPFVASECCSLGQFVTPGHWHPEKNRWMWGPKMPRR